MCTVELSLERVPQRDYDDDDAGEEVALCQDAAGEVGGLCLKKMHLRSKFYRMMN